MKSLCTIFFLTVNLILTAQTTIIGEYNMQEGALTQLNIKPTGLFEYKSIPPCFPSQTYIVNGAWKLLNDSTIILASADTSFDTLKILSNNQLGSNKGGFIQFKNPNDTTKIIRQWLYSFYKVKGYYQSGETEWIQDVSYDFKSDTWAGVCTYFYQDSKILSKGQIKNSSRNGSWSYYNKEGQITKVEYYKKGKLKKTKTA